MTMKTSDTAESTSTVKDDLTERVKELEEVKVAGGSIVDDKPSFCADSKFLFVINDGAVHGYNVATGELAGSLEGAHPIVALSPEPSNPRQLITADASGSMILWDFVLATSLKKWSLSHLLTEGSTVAGLVRPAGWSKPLLLVRGPGTEEPLADLLRQPTKKEGRPARPVLREVRRGAAGRWEVDCGWQGRLVAAIVKRNELLVRNLWNKDSAAKQKYSSLRTDADRPFTCVACHPSEATVAAGDSSGRLLLWRRLLAGDQPPVRSVLHWHTLPVPSVGFSPEGTYLVSGGGECVLVFWQTHDEKPSFVPRLGMAIRHVTVSPDNQLVVTSHSDNVLRLVTPQRQVSRVIHGLTWGAGGAPSTGLVLEPRSGAVLLNGAVGHLQLFCPHTRRDLYSLDVVQTNYLTRERTGAPVTCDVTRVAVTSDGAWMATLEERDDGQSTAERRLKIWEFDDTKQSFVLNTCVEDPHESSVTALEFQPGDAAKVAPLAVTTGTDGAIKYWSLVDDSDIYGAKRCWSCDAVGSHHRLPAGCAAFSADGERLAVGFAASVTVWAPTTNTLQHTLSNVTVRGDVRQVAFGRGECSHLLVSRTDSGLRVWSLQSLTLTARIDVHVTSLVADPLSEYMAAFSASNKVFVFRPSSTRPVHQAALGRPVSAACFVPHQRPRPDLPEWQRASQLFFLNDQQALHTLDVPEAAGGAAGSVPSADVIGGQVRPTPFGALVAEQRRSAVTSAETVDQSEVTPGLQKSLELLEGPSHTMPPLTRICLPFLLGLLPPPVSDDVEMTETPQPEGQGDDSDSGEKDDSAAAATAAAAADDDDDKEEDEEEEISPAELETRLDNLLNMDFSWLTV
ncbi:WD repeat-containing protein 75-like [Amphibalanus amphitrite]|uniref:WD repeat-containing protein 75-like n=1 Tax=Amphibalanus amphitrite TaxID=1232801 RepID=UPI001C90701E|nr:WD repeat-containing protein 75-like [Amphibalanus amphitrite]